MFAHLLCTRDGELRCVTGCSHAAGAAHVGVCWCFTAAWGLCRAGRDATGLQVHYCWVHRVQFSWGPCKVSLLCQPERSW